MTAYKFKLGHDHFIKISTEFFTKTMPFDKIPLRTALWSQ